MQSLTFNADSVDETVLASSPIEALLEAAGDLTLHLSDQGILTFTSRSLQDWARVDRFKINKSFFELFEATVRPYIKEAFGQVLTRGKVISFSAPLVPEIGKSLSWKLCRYGVGQKRGVLAVARDITNHEELELRLQQASRYDGLTSLPNRATAHELCLQMQTEALHLGRTPYFILVKVSGLTRINTAMGSETGDQVLVQVVHRLSLFAEGEGRVSRIGSTEFGIFLKSKQSKEELIRSARQLVVMLEAPYFFGNSPVHIKARIGITSVTGTGTGFDELFASASRAVSVSKEISQVEYLEVSKGGIPESKEFMRLEAALHDGVRNGELYLAYQPLVSASGMYGVEALMRWKQSDGTEVSPSVFIPVAESNGLIHLVGEWALKRAIFEISALNQKNGLSLQVSVNVSPVQFVYPGFVRSVIAVLDSSGLAPNLLQLEITEGTLMKSPEFVEPLLAQLAKKGVQIAVDDFGTGYSSLAYLKRFALTTLKIDQSFVRDLPNNSADLAVCSAISELSHKLGLKVVAEGIETRDQYEALKAHCNCAGYQGYLFGRPSSLSDLVSITSKINAVINT